MKLIDDRATTRMLCGYCDDLGLACRIAGNSIEVIKDVDDYITIEFENKDQAINAINAYAGRGILNSKGENMKESKMKESERTGKHVTFDFTGAPGYMEDGLVTVEQDSVIMVTWPNGYQEKLTVEVDSPYVGTEIIHNPRNFTESKSKKKKVNHKPYKMREEENPYEWDVKTEKKALYKQFPAMSDNEITIRAASKVAKKNKVARKTVLATLKPSNNIKGERTWGKDGKVFKESVKANHRLNEACLVSPTGSYTANLHQGVHIVGLQENEFDDYGESDAMVDETGLTEYQKDCVIDTVKADFECGHVMGRDDYDEMVHCFEDDGDFEGVAENAAEFYFECAEMGPAGFYEEHSELDWDPDFIAEYGEEEFEENKKIKTGRLNESKKPLKEAELEVYQFADGEPFVDSDGATWLDGPVLTIGKDSTRDEIIAAEQQVEAILEGDHIYADYVTCTNPAIQEFEVSIDGDWKHDHIDADHQLWMKLHLTCKDTRVTRDSEDDSYGAIHVYYNTYLANKEGLSEAKRSPKAKIQEKVLGDGKFGIEVKGAHGWDIASKNFPKPGIPEEFDSEKKAKESDLWKRLVDRYGEKNLRVFKQD